ncbi:hypothetical protein [Fischerella thermalis]|nr:hypothetical protein [Fischerella thermalis]
MSNLRPVISGNGKGAEVKILLVQHGNDNYAVKIRSKASLH